MHDVIMNLGLTKLSKVNLKPTTLEEALVDPVPLMVQKSINAQPMLFD